MGKVFKMNSLSDIENLSLPSLYELLSTKIREMTILQETHADDPEYSVRRTEIEAIQKIIDAKKVKPFYK